MSDLLRGLEALRDKWDETLGSRYYSKVLTALLAKYAWDASLDRETISGTPIDTECTCRGPIGEAPLDPDCPRHSEKTASNSDLRERVAREMYAVMNDAKDVEVTEPLSFEVADRILAIVDAEKARGPDPLLVQARAALVRAKANADSWGCHDNIIDAAIAALDERLGRKP
jgi:hypothetical protein